MTIAFLYEVPGENASVTLAASAALAAAAGWGLGTVLFERALRSRSSAAPPSAAAANFFKNGLAMAVFLGIALAAGAAWPGRHAWGPLLFSGLLGFAIGDTCTFAALPRCGVQICALLSNLIPPFAALLAYLFLGESLAPATLAFMGVVLAGIVLVILDRDAVVPNPELKRSGVIFAVFAALAQAVAIVAGRKGFDGVEVLPGTVARLSGGVGGAILIALGFSLFARLRGERSADSSARRSPGGLFELGRPLTEPRLGLRLVIPTLFAAVLVLPLHSFAVRGAPGGVSAALLATTPLFTLPILAAFGGKAGWRTWAGTIIGFCGSLGTIWSIEGP